MVADASGVRWLNDMQAVSGEAIIVYEEQTQWMIVVGEVDGMLTTATTHNGRSDSQQGCEDGTKSGVLLIVPV
jgi:hypothetical protein